MDATIGLVIGILLAAVVSGVIIWIVDKLNMGLKVDNFGWAMLAGVLIGFLTNVIMKLLPGTDGLVHVLVNLVVSAVAIFISGAILKGMTVNGYTGALIAAVGIALVNFVLLFVVLGGAKLAAA
jgi:uncharacterized membrane protein YvlD (DUF360 family)